MTINEQIEKIKEAIRQGRFTSEAAVSQGILLPFLNTLGWPVFDTSIVVPEYSLEGRRVDYGLCHPANRPAVFIEVKKIGFSEGADRQLFEYAFHAGVPMAILTNGQEWSFYLPGEQGRYDERRVYKLDLLERSATEASDRLNRYLSYERVCSGEALRSARSDYQNVARSREIEAILPKAWRALLEEQDSLLLDLLAEKVEDLCGYKPDIDTCANFLGSILALKPSSVLVQLEQNNLQRESRLGGKRTDTTFRKSRTRTVDNFVFSFKGQKYRAGSAREVVSKIFQLLAKEDGGFLERFAARKHGKKRRYLARNRNELYPGRPDLSDEHSTEIADGWWMGTNYSRRDLQKMINLAREVVGPALGSQVDAKVE
jgi:hypothetical protein